MKTIITDRDHRVLRTLSSYELLTTKLVAELVFPNVDKRTVLRRLRKLAHEKLIRKIHGLKKGQVIWALTSLGAQRIGEDGFPDAINRNSLEHDMTLAEIRIHLEKSELATSWMSEQKLRRLAGKRNSRNENILIPDAIFATKTPQGFEPVALELELSGKNGRRYQKIFSRYRYQEKFYSVWYIVPNKSLGQRIEREWQKINSDIRRPVFQWNVIGDVLKAKANSNHGTPAKKPAHTAAHSVSSSISENRKEIAS